MQSVRSKILGSSLAVAVGVVAASTAAINGCSSGSSPPVLDAGRGQSDAPVGKGCTTPAAVKTADGFSLTPSPCVDQAALEPGQLLLTASGEILALDGYQFPVDPNGKFADGWQVTFQHYIATFDKVSLWDNPDTSTTDQSQVGTLVAELDGPWAVDMHLNHPDFPYIDGKEQGERAVAFAVLANQNKNGNAALPTDGTRLAVGFSAVTATKALRAVLRPPVATSKLRAVNGDAHLLPFADGEFSLAFGFGLLDRVERPGTVASEFARVLKPGGVAVLSCLHDFAGGPARPEDWLGGAAELFGVEAWASAEARRQPLDLRQNAHWVERFNAEIVVARRAK
jgi:SAM-dependent methyltransferase